MSIFFPLSFYVFRLFSESMFKPAIRHVFSALALQFNRVELLDYFEIFYLNLVGCLEWSYLFTDKSSTFLESVNGYKRVNSSDGGELSFLQRSLSFLYLLLMPRMIDFLKKLKESLEVQRVSGSSFSWFKQFQFQLMKYALKFAEYGLTFESIGTMIFRILYLLKKIPFHNPLFYFLQMKLVRKRALIDNNHSSPEEMKVSASQQRNWQMGLIIGIIFAVRGMEWYLSNDFSSDLLVNKIHSKDFSIPPYPKPFPISAITKGTAVVPLRDKSLCPLCAQKRKNPCATSSGYVFCYECILSHLRDQRQNCPITGIPCREEDLIIVYDGV
jgi:hypothetical protein